LAESEACKRSSDEQRIHDGDFLRHDMRRDIQDTGWVLKVGAFDPFGPDISPGHADRCVRS